MKKMISRQLGIVSAIAAAGLALTACGGGVNATVASSAAAAAPAASAAAPTASSAAPAPAECGKWGLQMSAWSGYTASAQVLTEVANKVLGCDITQTLLDEAAVTYDAMEAGSVDVVIEDWGGGRWKEWVDRGAIMEAGPDGNVGLIGMYVPQWMADKYPDILDSKNLNKYADLFKTPESGGKGAWYEGPPGYTTIGQQMIDANKLNFKAINTGSEAALLDVFTKADKNKTPAIGYLWEPLYFLANVPVARVNFPANDWTDAAKASGLTDYGALDLAKLITTKLADSGSTFATLVKNFSWTNADQNSVAADIEGGMDPAEAAQKWIDANKDTVNKWLEGTGASVK